MKFQPPGGIPTRQPPEQGPASDPRGNRRRYALEWFVITAVCCVAVVFGLSRLFEPAGIPEAPLAVRRYFFLAQGALSSFLVTVLAVLVIARRVREAEASERKFRAITEAA